MSINNAENSKYSDSFLSMCARNPMSQSVSVLPLTRFNHLWTIRNFSYIPSDVEFICCPNFSPPGSKDKWFMKLRPKTVDEASKVEYIGVHLFLRSSEERAKLSVRAKYAISILDAEGEQRFSGECSRHEGRIFKAGTEGHGYKLLAPRDHVLNPSNNILGPNDSLKILCEITVFGDLYSGLLPNPVEIDHSEESMADGSLSSDLNFLTKTNFSTDVVIEGKDGVQVKAHKIVLSARSKVFRAMFGYDTKEKAESKIQVQDLDGAVLREMINFVYTDRVDNYDDCYDLLVAADKYDMPKLKRLCEQYLARSLTTENAGYMLIAADTCNCKELKERVLEFVIRDPTKVINSEAWNKQVSRRPSLFKEAFDRLAKKPRLY